MNKTAAVEGVAGFFAKWGNNLNANKTITHAIKKDMRTARRVERSAVASATKHAGTDAGKTAKNIAKRAHEEGNAAKGAGKFMKGKDMSTIDAIKSYRNSRLNVAEGFAKDGKLGTMGKIASDMGTAKSLAGSYFMGGTAAQNATRIGTVGAGYMGVNLAGRGLTGGTLTKNNKGERDIAGIPFI